MLQSFKNRPVWLVALTAICLTSCFNKQPLKDGRHASGTKYSKLLSLTENEGRTDVTVYDPWQDGRVMQTISIGGVNMPHALQPLRRVVVMSTAHCQLLEYLGMADRIVGVCDLQYIRIPDIQRRVEEGQIADCGDGMSPDIERIISLNPDAIIASPLEGTSGFGKLDKLGIPIIQAADYMETSALGRAEWMRYYGRLMGCGSRADSLFHVVDSTYQSLTRYASKLSVGRSVITERKTGSTWYTPGGQSTIASIIKDAHGRYPYSDDKHSGSLPLSAEQIINKAGQSDVWAFKYEGSSPMTKADLLAEYHGYESLKAFKTGEIYECNTLVSPFFEEVPFRPDYLLREMIILLHRDAKLGKPRYYVHLRD